LREHYGLGRPASQYADPAGAAGAAGREQVMAGAG
jgi:hypothetical protein